MIRRVLPVAQKFSSLQRTAWPVCIRSMASGHAPTDYVYPTMDELPVPCGDWQEDFNNKQRKYNVQLLLGVGVFSITVAVAYYSGLFWTNLYLPEKPGPRPEPKC